MELFNIIVGIVGALGFVFSIPGLINSYKNRSIPRYTMLTQCLIRDKREVLCDLSVKYKEKTVDNISVTVFAFWNSGNQVLSSDNYSKDRLPKIHTANSHMKILGYKLLESYDNDFIHLRAHLIENNEEIVFEFDKINKMNGFVLQIIHSGTRSKDIVPDINFDIIKPKAQFIIQKDRSSILDWIAKTIGAFSLCLLTFAFLLISILYIFTGQEKYAIYIPLFIISFIGAVLWLYSLIKGKLFPYKGMPKRFYKYFNDNDKSNNI